MIPDRVPCVCYSRDRDRHVLLHAHTAVCLPACLRYGVGAIEADPYWMYFWDVTSCRS